MEVRWEAVAGSGCLSVACCLHPALCPSQVEFQAQRGRAVQTLGIVVRLTWGLLK